MTGTTDPTARIAELTALIRAKLAEDEAPSMGATGALWRQDGRLVMTAGRRDAVAEADTTLTAEFIAANGPDRVLARADAVRELVSAILAEEHDYNVGDEFYSCSQAVEYGTDGEPGSGCFDPERAGKPCDCGRDARVARLLSIIAGEWEDS